MPRAFPPAEALEFLEKCGDTGQWSDGDSLGAKSQIENIQKWAQQTGHISDFDPSPEMMLDSGSEHEVFFHTKENRIFKRTYPPGVFGLVGFGHKLERIGTPYFYVRRMALMNRVFDSEIHIMGFTPGDKPSIITSQFFYKGVDASLPHPSREEIAIFMYGQGFLPLPNVSDGWSRKADAIIALDTRSDNFIKTAHGTVPIDLVLQGRPGKINLEEVVPASKEVRGMMELLKQMKRPTMEEVTAQVSASKAFRAKRNKVANATN